MPVGESGCADVGGFVEPLRAEGVAHVLSLDSAGNIGAVVPRGAHEVSFRYRAPGCRAGAVASGSRPGR